MSAMKRAFEIEVLEWNERPPETPVRVEVTCEKCAADLLVPAASGVRVLATIGMGMIHDTTPEIAHGLPDAVRCPRCLSKYSFDRN